MIDVTVSGATWFRTHTIHPFTRRRDAILSPLSLAETMQHTGGDPVLWLSNFSTIKRLRPEDAVYIQLEAWCSVLSLAGQCGLLDPGGNACLEEVARLNQSYVDAYSDTLQSDWAWKTESFLARNDILRTEHRSSWKVSNIGRGSAARSVEIDVVSSSVRQEQVCGRVPCKFRHAQEWAYRDLSLWQPKRKCSHRRMPGQFMVEIAASRSPVCTAVQSIWASLLFCC